MFLVMLVINMKLKCLVFSLIIYGLFIVKPALVTTSIKQ